MIRRLILFLVGLALLPLCLGLLRAILDLFPMTVIDRPPWIAAELLALCAGYLLWTAVYLIYPPSISVYIWGHELTHALWGGLTGSRVGRIRVRDTGGSVTLSEAGVATFLAPYFVPFYTAIVVLLRLLLGLFAEMDRWEPAWMFLFGFTWGFHITYTARSLLQHQPDMQNYGRIFSCTVIVALNLLVFGYLLVAATAATANSFHRQIVARTVPAYRESGGAIGKLARGAARMMRSGKAGAHRIQNPESRSCDAPGCTLFPVPDIASNAG